eukprot:3470858-Prymnesium_polylepis.1
MHETCACDDGGPRLQTARNMCKPPELAEERPTELTGFVEKLDRAASSWEGGSKSKFASFSRSHLLWYDKPPSDDGVLQGALDLRMVETLRESEVADAPLYAFDIVPKASDRVY